ncbi:hypothetical protein RIF29_25391 [Crotalaria pallida]|uniref:Auxin response factor domain-containing protein n=1 Tax=Crotalaria pallida TaxID=3830 RepID=A0AAN9HZ91_CROPI
MEKNEKLSVENKKKSVTDDDSKINYGGWKVMPYIVGNETFENLGAIGTLANLLVYLTSVFNLNSITATNIINIFNGSANLATLLGAFLSDTYFGRYITLGFCIVASFLNCYPNFLSYVANAIFTKSMFHVFYSPRASQPDFIVPYKKYVKSIKNEVIIGTRFKMRFQMDESPERRCNNGMVIGMSDLDPYRWPKSKWRCLMVRWDENIETNHQDRVSPWEIDPSASLPQLSIQSSPRLKKLRTGQQATSPSHLFTGMHPNAEIKHTSLFLTTC